jgi:hypothetical protein
MNVYSKMHLQGFIICPYPKGEINGKAIEYSLRGRYPQKSLVATILSREGIRHVNRFLMTIEGLVEFREWFIGNCCERVAVDSTGRYWVPVHSVLEDHWMS